MPSWRPPLTFAGVARYAQRMENRELRHLGLWGALCGFGILWAVLAVWEPVIDQAVGNLPSTASLRAGRLEWPDSNPLVLANNRSLSLIVNPGESATVDRTSDIQVEFGANELRIRSYAGWWFIPYPGWMEGTTGKDAAIPWWGAWKPMAWAAVFAVSALGLCVSWLGLGFVYAVPVRLILSWLGRSERFGDAWRLSMAALFPSALFMVAALWSYAFAQTNALLLTVFWGLHWLVGWVYLAGALLRWPKRKPKPVQQPLAPEVLGQEPANNPFSSSPTIETPPAPSGHNPFHGAPPSVFGERRTKSEPATLEPSAPPADPPIHPPPPPAAPSPSQPATRKPAPQTPPAGSGAKSIETAE